MESQELTKNDKFITRTIVSGYHYSLYSFENGESNHLKDITVEEKLTASHLKAYAKEFEVKKVVAELTGTDSKLYRLPISKFMELAEIVETK